MIDLPDPDDEIVRYLPSRSPEGEESGISHRKAEALCRRMVAVHCLYGVDKNPLAVELAKLALWLESHAEGMPLTFLDHRLVLGDSLTGRFWDKLIMRPSAPKEPVEGIFHQGLTLALQNKLAEALSIVRHLEATVGVSLSEVEEKERLKAELDQALRPFRIIAAAWSGGVMLGPDKCDDLAYADLLKSVAETGEIPERIESNRSRPMIARGLGLNEVPANRSELYDLLASNGYVPALPYEIIFPDVFYPTGVPHGRCGFNAVLSNPPWDRLEVKEEEYWSRYDLEVLSYSDKDARRPLIEKITEESHVAAVGWEAVNEAFEQDWRIQQKLYAAQTATVEGRATTGRPDFYRVFAERGNHLLKRAGKLGWVLPSGFDANEGATGIRKLYLNRMTLNCCYSFQNRKKLFEIDSRQKFAAIVAMAGGTTDVFSCAFYLEEPRWLYGERDDREELKYRREYVERVGGEYLSFPECRSQVEADLLGVVYGHDTTSLDDYLESRDLDFSFGVELHRNRPFNNPMPSSQFGDELFIASSLWPEAQVPVFRGKSFWQFSDRGEFPIDVVAPLAVVLGKGKWNPA